MKFKIPMARPWITREDREAVMCVLKSGRLSMGPEQEALEHEFSRVHGYRHAICVSSGGAAIALMAKKHKYLWLEVTGGSFPGVYNALDFVHAFFLPVNRGEYAECPRRTIYTALYNSENIEPRFHKPDGFADLCEAVGVSFGTQDACYSFYPNKQICGGEGGIICTNDTERASWYRRARNNGRNTESWAVKTEGMNFRMDEMSAALIRSQLARLQDILRFRRFVYDYYVECLNTTCSRSTPISVFAYVWETDDARKRLAVERAFQRQKIDFRRTFPPQRNCPKWEDYYKRTLLLPFWTTMKESEIETVCRIIRKVT